MKWGLVLFFYTLTLFLCELRHVINMLTSVARVWHTESKIKVEKLEQFVPKVVPFDHLKAIDWLITNCELHPVKIWSSMYEKER